jgi:hypothetical protein
VWCQAIEMHAQCAKRITVCHHKCGALGGEVGGDRVLPVRHKPSAHRGQGLRVGQVARGQRGVAGITARMLGVIGSDRRRSEVIGTPPVGIDLSAELPADVAATPAL